jgi:hypothetical protein
VLNRRPVKSGGMGPTSSWSVGSRVAEGVCSAAGRGLWLICDEGALGRAESESILACAGSAVCCATAGTVDTSTVAKTIRAIDKSNSLRNEKDVSLAEDTECICLPAVRLILEWSLENWTLSVEKRQARRRNSAGLPGLRSCRSLPPNPPRTRTPVEMTACCQREGDADSSAALRNDNRLRCGMTTNGA